MSSSKKNLPIKGLCGRCLSAYLPPSPYTLNTCIQFTYSHIEGGGGESRGEKQQFTKLVENTNMTDYVSSLQTLVNTCRKVSFQVIFFRWLHFALVSIKLISPCWLSQLFWKGFGYCQDPVVSATLFSKLKTVWYVPVLLIKSKTFRLSVHAIFLLLKPFWEARSGFGQPRA
jgi:hypothetical protein